MKFPDIKTLKRQDFGVLLESPTSLSRYGLSRRVIDIALSVMVIVFFSPVWLLLAIIIAIATGENPIFTHQRVGKGGKKFTCYKFRTMKKEAGKYEFGPTTPDDSRITVIGRFLRRTSLDEIPQFFNVLVGDMGLVGPRPEMPFIVERYNQIEKCRLLVKPGITGLWQIMGRKDLPLHENVEYDLYYILNRSVWMDFIIMLKTIHVIINGRGAY